jgi:hypothetical protein
MSLPRNAPLPEVAADPNISARRSECSVFSTPWGQNLMQHPNEAAGEIGFKPEKLDKS